MDAALGLMPKHAVLLIDESSAALSSRMGAGVAASSCGEMTTTAGSGTAKVFSMFAQDWEIAPAIRRETRQAGMPVPREKLTIDGGYAGITLRNPAEDPDTCRIAWFASWAFFDARQNYL